MASAALCLSAVIGIEAAIFLPIPHLVGSTLPGGTVLLSWLALRVSGRWLPEASWIDRSGRLMGAIWLATIPWVIWLAM